MKIWIFIVLLVSLVWVTPAFSNPIKGIDLEYDIEGQVLTINIKHISHNRRQEYIRKIMVYKNGKMVEEKYYNLQSNPAKLEDTVDLKAEEGDVLKVKAYAAKGGSKSESMTIEAAPEKDEVLKEKVSKENNAPKGNGY